MRTKKSKQLVREELKKILYKRMLTENTNPFKKGDSVIVDKIVGMTHAKQSDARRFNGKKGIVNGTQDDYVYVRLKGFKSPSIEFHKNELKLAESVNENIETLLSPEDLKYYRAHRDEIEDILHAEWRSSKLSAKDAVEKHKENKLQQAKRGGGDETSLRAIAALGNNPLKELHDPRMDDPRYGSSPRKFAELRDRLGDSILLDHIALMDVNDLEDLIDKLGEV